MKYFIIIVFVLISIPVQAQPQWINYTPQNSGLPSFSISDIAFDTLNRKWISTLNGIAMFDGTNWTVYDTNNSELPGNNVYSIAVDRKNIVWAATNNGLARFNGSNWIIYDTLGFKDISRILVDSNNLKWVTSYLGGLMKYNDTNWIYYRTDNSGIQSNTLSDLASEGHVKWITTAYNGLIRYNDTTFINYTTTNSGIETNLLRCISVDRNGDKWIGRFLNYAVKYNSKNITWVNYNNYWPGLTGSTVTSVYNDIRNVKWFGTLDNLFSFNDTALLIHNSAGFYKTIKEDKYNNLWFCTGYGIYVHNPNGIVSVNENNLILPSKFYVYQNYPNPFNPETNIQFDLPKEGLVTLKVYDILGREVKNLVNEFKQAGSYIVSFDASSLSSGVYFYRLDVNGFSDAKRMILIK